jgi:type I restriction enzyme, S subunit
VTWNTVPLGNILVQSSNHKQIEPGQSYKQITVRLWGKGLVLRGVCDGAEISANRQIAAQTGDFIISKIDARHGAFGLVPAELNDALVSNDFPCFKVNEEALAPSYLKWYAKTEAFVALCKQSSVGSTNRVRLKEGRFLELEIPLPSLDEQHVIARCLDSISDGVIEASNLADAALADLHALVFSLHESLSEPEQVSLGSLIELDERIEIVEDDGEYPQLGLRSFGNGLFFKDAVNGAATSYKKFNTAYQGALVVSQPKGWEGAVAVATADHEGWYLSPEYRTFRFKDEKLDPDYFAALIVTPWFQHALSKMTKGQGARRERLRPEMLLEFELQMPKLAKQQQALKIIANAQEVSKRLAMRQHEMSALLPALLHQIFEQ